MRKLLGSWANWTLPVVAVAVISGCQSSPRTESTGARNVGVQGAALAGEKAGALEDLASLCGFECNTLADGTASISGDAKIDSFFQAVLSLKGASAQLEGEVNATLGEMAALVGAEAGASASVTADNIAAEFSASGSIGAQLDGGITLKYVPPQCSVSAQATLQAKAKCEGKVDPGSASVECKGECTAKADAMLECSGSATLECKGTAPSFNCEGSCEGSCELDVAAKCEGTCNGTCELTAAGKCDGECSVALDSDGNCTGECKLNAGAKCEGECKGSCELKAGGTCEGKCKGECTYEAPSGGCDASAQASCKAEGSASVMCNGECKGEVTPPSVEADCEASVKAEAQFSAECTPPDIGLEYSFAASLQGNAAADVTARAELTAKLEAFAKLYGKLVAKGARIEGILKVAGGLGDAGIKAVTGSAETLTGSGDLKVKFKAACAVTELGAAATAITDAGGKLTATAGAIGKVTAAVGT